MPPKLTTQNFIDRARIIHDDKYGYALSVCQGGCKKVLIYCREHGMFEQTPTMHLQGQRCPVCAGNKQLTTDIFIKSAKLIHEDKYDYSLVKYTNANTPVKIICREHGMFEQRPNTHINRKQGCRKCSGYAKDTLDSFIEKANSVHGEKYEYSLVNYIDSQTPVKIVCYEHGEFNQRPNDHINGVRCPGCANVGFNKTKEGYVYLLRSECGQYAKIGITHVPKRRHAQLTKATPFPFHVIECIKGTGSQVTDTEREILNHFNSAGFTKSFDGSTEWLLWSPDIRLKLLTLMDEGHSHV